MSTIPRTSTSRSLVTAAIAACLLGLSACGGGSETRAPAAPSAAATADHGEHGTATPTTATGTLDAADQTSDGTSVTVASASIEAGGNGGWIALHQDADGKPGPVKYTVAVPAGASTDIVVPTPEGIATGAFWPMLHVDDGVVGTYEFPTAEGADLPVKTGTDIVMEKIMVTVR